MVIKKFFQTSIICGLLLLTSCSTFSFVFERLDWFALWRLDSMFELSDKQEALLQPELIELQQWMRDEGFPTTIEKLEALLALWDEEKPEAAYLHLMSSLDELNQLYLNAMEGQVVKFSLSLTKENAQHYRVYTDDKQEDWFEPASSIDARIDDDIERLETWFGHLNDQQVNIIERMASLTENELQIRIDNLRTWRESFLQAALNRDTSLIRTWLNDLSIFWTEEYTLLKQHNKQQRQALLFELFPTLTLKQKHHARDYVVDLIDKLQDVIPHKS